MEYNDEDLEFQSVCSLHVEGRHGGIQGVVTPLQVVKSRPATAGYPRILVDISNLHGPVLYWGLVIFVVLDTLAVGIFNGPCGTGGGHAVLLIGYGRENGQDCWLIKNTFGVYWGENGFVRLERNVG
ncbi:hypothetical protein Taro_015160 [Colocasia esculenta]|uniref:Peptidase C1A papain C-terminal domain-containing protein n=1 Tax=Colocasia esculenta TaxID=4460 RepID=A0A843UKN0_COLES|nr:hypothetical protein [Colocasia esculenta]